MNEIVKLAVWDLTPNDYNPNEMTAGEFAELVAEVRHLGRLPKPIIVRPNGTNYTIVDGEHNWRAAQGAELTEIPCEVVEVDDFEAMRQTYKRNQHGTHNPVLLGQMFQRMKEERSLSNRQLAKEMQVSEGTIRNALLYAEAAEVRNDYAVEKLSIQQLRYLNALPERTAQMWLNSGADVLALFNAASSRKYRDMEDLRRELVGIPELKSEVVKSYQYHEDSGLLDAYFPEAKPSTSRSFIKLFDELEKYNKFEVEWFPIYRWYEDEEKNEKQVLKKEWRKYVASFLKRFRKSAVRYLNRTLAHIFDTETKTFLITTDDFEEIIDRDEYRDTGDLANLVRLAVYEKHGRYLEREDSGYDHPPTFQDKLMEMEINEEAPDYIKESKLVTWLKYQLWKEPGPEWAKRQLAKKSYIQVGGPNCDLDALVEQREYEKEVKEEWEKTNPAETARELAETIAVQNDFESIEALQRKLAVLKKEELIILAVLAGRTSIESPFKDHLRTIAASEEN